MSQVAFALKVDVGSKIECTTVELPQDFRSSMLVEGAIYRVDGLGDGFYNLSVNSPGPNWKLPSQEGTLSIPTEVMTSQYFKIV